MRHATFNPRAPTRLVVESPGTPLVGTLLAIDPGNDQGWAVYSAGVLCACGLGDVPVDYSRPRALVVEIPDRVNAGVPLASIITLALSAGRQLERYGSRVPEEMVFTPFPCQWKGNADKETTEALVWSSLASGEKDILRAALKAIRARSRHHNVVDAVRLGWVWTRKVQAMLVPGRIQTAASK